MIYLTGDTHGNPIGRLSFRKHPGMRNLTENDYVFILGDFGAIWDYHGENNAEKYTMNWLNGQKYTTIAIMGNHENWDRVLSLPIVDKWGGKVRATGYDKVWIVADPTVLDIDGEHILIIPGADSHDIYKCAPEADYFRLNTGYSNLIDPEKTPRFKDAMRSFNKGGLFYRVKGESWWPQEAINIEAAMELLSEHDGEHFDLVLTHDAPSRLCDWYTQGFGRLQATEGQRFLHVVAENTDFDAWFHGHYHIDRIWPHTSGFEFASYEDKMCCVYRDILIIEPKNSISLGE